MVLTPDECRALCTQLRCALIIPTYNNAGTLPAVLADALRWCPTVFVVNDGCTDNTAQLLANPPQGVEVITYPDGRNRGKGHALITGLRHLCTLGYAYALTMDADGQHFADDIPNLLEPIVGSDYKPGTLLNPNIPSDVFVIGARNIQAEGMPSKNTFANKFSNFWFKVETLITMSDTQSGFRLYPLRCIEGMRFFTPRYEFEVEVAVRLAWKGCRVLNVPIKVIYPEDRVSHFRPGRDFFRISVLNTVLCLIAFFWYYPVALIRWCRSGRLRTFVRENLTHTGESTARRASAVALGVAMSVMPIWGFQTVAAVGLAHLLRLNKIVTGACANVSLPPLIPFIVYAAVQIGSWLTGCEPLPNFSRDLTAEAVGGSALTYVVGSVVLGLLLGVVTWPLTWGLIKLFDRQK